MLQTNEVIIQNWRVVMGGDAYTPPECRTIKLNGEVYNHPSFPDGSNVTTSRIEKVEGRRVKTYSRWYNLGDPDPEYVDWCEENGIDPPTWENPIRFKQ